MSLQPDRISTRDRFERGADGLGNLLEAVERPQGSQDMRRTGPLASSRPRQAVRHARVEQGVQQQVLRVPHDQGRPKVREDREVESRILQAQTEEVVPIDSSPHRVGRRAIGETLGELQDRHDRQAPRRIGRSAPHRKQSGGKGIVVDRSQAITHLHRTAALWERRSRRPLRLAGNRPARLGLH